MYINVHLCRSRIFRSGRLCPVFGRQPYRRSTCADHISNLLVNRNCFWPADVCFRLVRDRSSQASRASARRKNNAIVHTTTCHGGPDGGMLSFHSYSECSGPTSAGSFYLCTGFVGSKLSAVAAVLERVVSLQKDYRHASAKRKHPLTRSVLWWKPTMNLQKP